MEKFIQEEKKMRSVLEDIRHRFQEVREMHNLIGIEIEEIYTMINNKKLPELIEFKHPHLKDELYSEKLDNRLLVILYALSTFVYFNFKKILIITEIFRTQELQDLYYRDNLEYKIKKWHSVHQYWRGIDCSVYYFTDKEQEKIIEFLNSRFQYSEFNDYKVGLIHSVSDFGKHLHLQVDGLHLYTKILK